MYNAATNTRGLRGCVIDRTLLFLLPLHPLLFRYLVFVLVELRQGSEIGTVTGGVIPGGSCVE